MGTYTAGTLINKAAILLNDEMNVRWKRTELLLWLGQAQRVVAAQFPAMCNVIATFQLVPGTKQYIPAAGWMLLDVMRNMGVAGVTPGNAIRVISQELLDGFNPSWHTAAQTNSVENYVYSPKQETAFYVYPPSDGTTFIEVNYAIVPADPATEAAALIVSDVVEPILVDYMCFRAYSKDAEYAAGLQLASMYMSSFSNALHGKDQAELQNQPNLDLAPYDPTVRGSA